MIDDDGGGVEAASVEAELDLLVAEVDGGFVASAGEAEGVVFFDLPVGLGVEEFVVVFGRRQEAEARQVDAEAVDRLHADGVVRQGVVVVFDPVSELAVEGFEGGEVEVFDEELVADTAEESLDFALGSGVADGRVAENAADAGADERDLLTAVDGAVVDQQLLGDAAFVEGGADGLDHGVDVFLEEELAVAEDAAGVVDEGDELGLLARGAGHASVDMGPKHGVGLPELVGVFHAEGEAFLVVVVVGSEQVVLANEAVESRLGDAVGLQEAFFDAAAIEGALVGAVVVEVRPGGVDGFEEFLGCDLACLALVLARAVGHAGDAVVLVAVVPGLDGAPGELALIAFLVEEGHGGDVVDAFVAGSALDGVDGAQNPHLQIDRRQLHQVAPGSGGFPGDDRLHQKSWRTCYDSLRCWALREDFALAAGAQCADNLVTGAWARIKGGRSQAGLRCKGTSCVCVWVGMSPCVRANGLSEQG